MNQHVIVLHGLGRNARAMQRVAQAASAAGYNVTCPDYPSRHHSIIDLVEHLSSSLPPSGLVHMIGHSLGGLLALRLMLKLPVARRGRIVQLGSPNLGTPFARRSAAFSWLLGPALQNIESPQPKFDETLEVGAIAGNAAWRPYGLITGIWEPNDGKVTCASAHGHAKHKLTLPLSHATMMNAPSAIAAALHFLEHGYF